jgi:actin-related protein
MENLTIVIDNGTGYIKAGFPGSDTPKVVFPTLIGRPQNPHDSYSDFYVRDSVVEKSQFLNIKCPILHGIINDWDDMEKIWDHTFKNELKESPSGNKIMLTEVLMNTKKNNEKTAEIMFEKFNASSLGISKQGPLILIAAGTYDGFVLDSGEAITQFCCSYDGKTLPYFIKMNFGGKNITKYLLKIIADELGISLVTYSEQLIAKDIKEKICYVALDFEEEKKNIQEKNYKMPDGTEIKLT